MIHVVSFSMQANEKYPTELVLRIPSSEIRCRCFPSVRKISHLSSERIAHILLLMSGAGNVEVKWPRIGFELTSPFEFNNPTARLHQPLLRGHEYGRHCLLPRNLKNDGQAFRL